MPRSSRGVAAIGAILGLFWTTPGISQGIGPALPTPGSIGAMKTDASNAVLPTARTSLGLTPYSPMSYGAVCDSDTGGSTDDTVALNAMFAAIRAAGAPFVVDGGNKTCYHTGTINMTGFTSFGNNLFPSVINLRLDCRVNAGPCADALGSRWIRWDNLYIYGEQINGPTYGLQIGDIVAGQNADMHVFEQPFIFGYFTKAALYNFASESISVSAPYIQNSAAGSSYGMVLDGCNHFNITSAFVTETIAADTCQSFNGNTVVGGWIGGHTPLWIEGTRGAKFISGYSAGISAGTGAEIYHATGGTENEQLSFDSWHFEPALADVFLITGTANPTLQGFYYSDYELAATNSLFKFGGSVTVGTVNNLGINVALMPAGTKVFDNAPQWVILSGNVVVTRTANWSGTPFLFVGQLCTTDGGCTISGTTLSSPTLTGIPLTSTAAPGTSTTQVASTAFVAAGLASGSGAVDHVSYQPGLLTAVNSTKAAFHKFSKASTVDNIEGSAATFSCAVNPTVTVYECGTSATCASSPVTIGTVTITAAGTVADGTVSSSTVAAGDYVAFAMSAGTCASVDVAVTVQTHVN